MKDPRDYRLDTQEVARPAASGAERIVVAMALLTLVGGLLIFAGNLLSAADLGNVVATAAPPTGQPTASATATPSPIPTPSRVELEAAPEPTLQPQQPQFQGWIRAKVDLKVMAAAQTDAKQLGVLAAGELASGYDACCTPETAGWFAVQRESGEAYVLLRSGGADLVERYPSPTYAINGAIWAVAAGPNGFVGIGYQSGTSASGPLPAFFHSTDGTRWQPAAGPPGAGISPTAVAWGPAGWLLAANGNDGTPWLSSSADGSHWTSLRWPGSDQSGGPGALVASTGGYLTSIQSYSRVQAQAFWFSTDGVHWRSVDLHLDAGNILIAGTPAGFYAWSDPGCCLPGGAFSPDGVAWSAVVGGPTAQNAQVTAVGDRLVALEMDATTGDVRAWLGQQSGGELAWQLLPDAGVSFAGGVVKTVVSTGDEAIAFGWDRTTEAPLAWTSTGIDWRRSALPAALGGLPATAAASSAGVVVVGHRYSWGGDDPIIWHRIGGDSWAPEPDPVIARVPQLSAADCAPLPPDALAWFLLDRNRVAACYGDRPMTFRAWSSRCDGCFGPGVEYTPAWLAQPGDNQLMLSPIHSQSNWMTGALAPALGARAPAAWLDAWLEVIGHFDDPAADTCRYTPAPAELSWYSGAWWTVNQCRQQFVVTSVRVVTGP
jgi:hypothetical protein